MPPIVFTLCSNNYLAHAKTLGDSLLNFHPELKFYIGLVDKKHPEIDYKLFSSFTILPFDEIGYDCFNDMLLKYNIIEFNTAVKPFYFDYFMKKYGAGINIYYIDPDICFYQGLNELENLLEKHPIILTPMITKPGLEVSTDELVALRHGMYNLGFICLKSGEHTKHFIQWWMKRLEKHCVIDKPRGLFVDQKWIDIATLFFDGIYILKHPGYNMAWWNLAERTLIELNNSYYVNSQEYPLVFFHFSGYKPGSPAFTGRVATEAYSFNRHPELKNIFEDYAVKLKNNQYQSLSNFKPLLNFYTPKNKDSNIKKAIKKLYKMIR
jgi:pterin-4a-carbinolamine dehydratase